MISAQAPLVVSPQAARFATLVSAALLPAILSLGLSACGKPERIEHAWLAMDTEFSAILHGPRINRAKVPPESAFAALESEGSRLELVFSDYLPYSALNSLRGNRGDTLDVPAPELAEVLRAAERAAAESEGIFDVTLHALKRSWGLSSGDTGRVPTDSALAKALAGNPTYLSKPEAHPALFPPFRMLPGNRILLLRDSIPFDLGGIAKGYAVDRMHALLDSLGYPDHLVMAGGDMRAGGMKTEGPWRIGIRHPRGAPDSLAGAVTMGERKSVSTSGDYERFFIEDGKRYHHLFDPRTGRPAGPWCSVTVLAGESLWADALSEPLFILGPEGGRGLLSRFDAEALWILPLPGGGLCHVPSAGLKGSGRYSLPGIPVCDEPGS